MRLLFGAPVVVWALACTPGGNQDTAFDRGDLAFASDSLELARSEYLLAVRQGRDDAASLARVAHTSVLLGRVEEGRSFYQDAVERDSAWVDQAAADFIHLAQEAAARNDRFQMAAAIDAASGFQPGMRVEGMALTLARHYYENGEYGRALPFYQEILSTSTDSVPDLVFEIGKAHDEIGDCERALVYFEQYRAMIEPWERAEVDWHIGTYSFRVAEEIIGGVENELERRPLTGDEERTLLESLEYIGRTIELGEPRSIQGEAWFERAEVLSRLGRCDEAMVAFEQVRDAEPSPNTLRARRAQERYDDLRFRRGFRGQREARDCG